MNLNIEINKDSELRFIKELCQKWKTLVVKDEKCEEIMF